MKITVAPLFFLAWLATVLPLLPHPVPVWWAWGALSGVFLVATAWLLSHLDRRATVVPPLLGCTAVIGIACLADYMLRSPVFLLAQCRTPTDSELLTRLVRHTALHWQWFPVTNGAMLLWIFLHGQTILARLASCLFMLCCMGIAMTMLESFSASVQKELSADGFVCAMLAGMCLHHLASSLYRHNYRFIKQGVSSWIKSRPAPPAH